MSKSDIALLGLGVMGKSLALNLLDHGFNVAGFDINALNRDNAAEQANLLSQQPGKGDFYNASSLSELLASLATPRVIALSVPAGNIVDSVIEELIAAGLEADDIVIDTGNSLWTDSERRERDYQGKLRFFSTAVSGGEVGARIGPSLMASGDLSAWQVVKPMWQAIAAKVDQHGQPLGQFESGESCAAYLGPAGAGHYVKMVHNGIEYADMQLICEAYHLMSQLPLSAQQIGATFAKWNQGVLSSYLLEISAEILQTSDPVTHQPFVDIVLDKAGQKGTGLWTAVNALQMGVPAPTIAQAVFARAQSGQKALRVKAADVLAKPAPLASNDIDTLLDDLHDALFSAKVAVYAQGFDLIKTTAHAEQWPLDFIAIAKIWRAGCIIRAQILQDISQAYQDDSQLENLLLAPSFSAQISGKAEGWRRAVAHAAISGVPMPAISSALSYYDGLRSAVLPANLLQAQRDYFGAHSYARVDEPEHRRYHLTWSASDKQQIEL